MDSTRFFSRSIGTFIEGALNCVWHAVAAHLFCCTAVVLPKKQTARQLGATLETRPPTSTASHFLGQALLPAICAALMLVASGAEATNVTFVGNVTYDYVGNTAVFTANRVQNNSSGATSGTLRMELWANAVPYSAGAQLVGYKLAEYELAPLAGGFGYPNVNSGTIPFTPPPDGTWYFVMFLTEYTGNFPDIDDGFQTDDWVNFSGTVVIGPPPPPPGPPPSAVTPQRGLWWNPNESGSGYAFDYVNGTLVVTLYSYQPDGSPQWYLSSGPLSGYTFTSTLDKYVGGQCISCAYSGRPTLIGNDGSVTIIFSSPTSATMYLPGGRVTAIQPEF
jgi:hypothetical protein